jgi:type II secretion system protein L
MTTLRVYFDVPPDPDQTADWALFDAEDKLMRSGHGKIGEWPAADAREAVIAAAHGRLTTLYLPPLPAQRAQGAVRYALEDQLAGTPEESHVAATTQAADGSVRVAVVSDHWIRTFVQQSQRCGIRWRRALLESDLALPPPGEWWWCATSLVRSGFVRTDRGASMAIGLAHGGEPPEELLAALAGSEERRPGIVRVNVGGASPAMLARTKARTGIEFVAGPPWRWANADANAFASAINLQSGTYDTVSLVRKVDPIGVLRPAVWIVATALGIYASATVGEWLWLQWQSSRIERELAVIAQSAAPESGGAAPVVAISRRLSELRHRVGLAAEDDFLPLLARAAPALVGLPPGALRSLRYADGHVVIDLQNIDVNRSGRFQEALRQHGLTAIAAPTATGARIRFGLD